MPRYKPKTQQAAEEIGVQEVPGGGLPGVPPLGSIVVTTEEPPRDGTHVPVIGLDENNRVVELTNIPITLFASGGDVRGDPNGVLNLQPYGAATYATLGDPSVTLLLTIDTTGRVVNYGQATISINASQITSGPIRATTFQQVGFFGATPVNQQPHPTTLGDVITLLTNLGLCAP